MSTTSKSQSSWTLIEKVKLVLDLISNRQLTDAEVRVATVLIFYFHNTMTGECFPSVRQLAEFSRVGEPTVRKTTHKLRSMGVLDFKQSTGGRCKRNTYTLLKGFRSDPFALCITPEKGVSQRPRGGSVATPLGGFPSDPAYIHRMYPKKEEEKKSDGFASPPDGGSPSQKEKGLQEKESQTLKRIPKASAKPFPLEKPPRWKKGDPDTEPTEQEIAELKKLGSNGGETPTPPADLATYEAEALKARRIAWCEKWRGQFHPELVEAAVAALKRTVH